MSERRFDQTEREYEDARLKALADTLKADGYIDAEFWHSGGGIMTVYIDLGDRNVVVGLANFPQWGYDVNDNDGNYLSGGSIDANVDHSAFWVAAKLAEALHTNEKIEIRF